MDLLLSPADLREVVAATPISPLPGRPRGILGVVIHQGEFLPVLAWEELPGGRAGSTPPVALAVLRPRLGLPLEQLHGMIDLPPEAVQESDESDPAAAWGSIVIHGETSDYRVVDTKRLIAVLRRFKKER